MDRPTASESSQLANNQLLKGARRRALLSGTAMMSLLFASAGSVLVTGCSSGGSGSFDPGADPGDGEFAVLGTTVVNNAVWRLNREILVEFTQDIDFSTVSSSTVQIVDSTGIPAMGTYSSAGPRTVRFQPLCPTDAANSNGGFAQGRTYRLSVVSQSNAGLGGGVTVTNTAGERLETGLNITFTTPTSTDPLVLFVDVVAGPPQVRVLTVNEVEPTSTEDTPFSFIEFGNDPDNVEFFRFDANAIGRVTSDVPLNLYSDEEQQFSVVLNFNQPIVAASTNVNTDLIRLQFSTDGGATYNRVPATVGIEANCTATGATVRVTPTGVVPQGSDMRILLREGFSDLTGDRIQSAQSSFANFQVTTANPTGPAGSMGNGSDEILEMFTVGGDAPGSLEDTTIASAQPRANWAQQ